MRYLVVGAAGHGQEVAWSLREQERVRGAACEVLFLDDTLPPGPLPSGLGRIVGGLDAAERFAAEGGACLVLGVGLPRGKATVVARLAPLGLAWATVVHPRATIGPNVTLGEGTYVAAGAILTVNVRCGRFVTVNMHGQVAHDGAVGDLATLHPDAHVAGRVTIGEGAELGSGALVIPDVTIGPWAVLGAGALALRPIAGGTTHVGIPARALPRAAAEPPPRGAVSSPGRRARSTP